MSAGPGQRAPIEDYLFPNGIPTDKADLDRTFELYKMMVASSESLVTRRQGVNTFFLTINGVILTAVGLLVSNGNDNRLVALSLIPLTITGCLLGLAWQSLILSFGQLNKGKFAIINRLEEVFPAAIYLAEWRWLDEGKNPSRYRTFTSREIWAPWTFFGVFALATLSAIGVAIWGGK